MNHLSIIVQHARNTQHVYQFLLLVPFWAIVHMPEIVTLNGERTDCLLCVLVNLTLEIKHTLAHNTVQSVFSLRTGYVHYINFRSNR